MADERSASALLDAMKGIAKKSDQVEAARRWLSEHRGEAQAGSVHQWLLKTAPSSQRYKSAMVWLDKYPGEADSPVLLATLLQVRSSAALLNKAKDYVAQVEHRLSQSGREPNFRRFAHYGPLLRQILTYHPRSGLFKSISELVEKYPAAPLWNSVFPLLLHEVRNRRGELLTARWIELNYGNPNLEVLGIPIATPCSEVWAACFNHISIFGNESAMGFEMTLAHLLRYVGSGDPLFEKVLCFSREWVQHNEMNPRTGYLHAYLVHATRSPEDCERARLWCYRHRENEKVSLALSAVLEVAELKAFPICEADIELAKEVIRHRKPEQVPRLTSALLRVHTTEETINWAKSVVEVHHWRHWFVLGALLEVAPSDSVQLAVETAKYWQGSDDEDRILLGILKADSTNKLARRRARAWVLQHPEEKGCRALMQMLD